MRQLILFIFILLGLLDSLSAQQLPPYDRTRQDQVLTDRASWSRSYLNTPHGTAPYFPAYVPDSLKNGALFTVNGGSLPAGLYRYNGTSGLWEIISGVSGTVNLTGDQFHILGQKSFDNTVYLSNPVISGLMTINTNGVDGAGFRFGPTSSDYARVRLNINTHVTGGASYFDFEVGDDAHGPASDGFRFINDTTSAVPGGPTQLVTMLIKVDTFKYKGYDIWHKGNLDTSLFSRKLNTYTKAQVNALIPAVMDTTALSRKNGSADMVQKSYKGNYSYFKYGAAVSPLAGYAGLSFDVNGSETITKANGDTRTFKFTKGGNVNMYAPYLATSHLADSVQILGLAKTSSNIHTDSLNTALHTLDQSFAGKISITGDLTAAGNNNFSGINNFNNTTYFRAGNTLAFVAPTGTQQYDIAENGSVLSILNHDGSGGLKIGPNTLTDGSGNAYLKSTDGYVPGTRKLTINGTQYDLSADRAWTIATPTYTNGYGLNLSSGTFSADTTVLKSKAGFLTDYNNLKTSISAKQSALTFASGITNTSGNITNDVFTGKTGNQTWYGSSSTTGTLNIQASSASIPGSNSVYMSLGVNGGQAILVSSYNGVGIGSSPSPGTNLYVGGGSSIAIRAETVSGANTGVFLGSAYTGAASIPDAVKLYASTSAAGNTYNIAGFYTSGGSVLQASVRGDGYFTGNGLNINAAIETTVTGSTSGSAKFSQAFQGTKLKKVMIVLISLNGTASYTFPTSFTYTPKVTTNNSMSVSALSNTAVTVTGMTTSDVIELTGY